MVEYQGKAKYGFNVEFYGAYDAAVTFRPGVVVTSGGSTYICHRTCKAVTPGTDSTAWTVFGSGATGATGAAGTNGTNGTNGAAGIPLTAHATSGRPSPGAAGNAYYDTTLHIPGFSDGTNWKDAAGNTI